MKSLGIGTKAGKGIGWNSLRNRKNLDALDRELKLKSNGKQMLAALEKAGLI
jgi:hypothetical protein